MIDAQLFAQALRAFTAGAGLATATVLQLVDDFADRLDPPGLDGYAGFGVRLDDLHGQEPDGYLVPEPRGRA